GITLPGPDRWLFIRQQSPPARLPLKRRRHFHRPCGSRVWHQRLGPDRRIPDGRVFPLRPVLFYSGGTYTTIDDPAATNGTFAFGINDSGMIVGQYMSSSGLHAF